MSRFDIELVGFDSDDPPLARFAGTFGIDEASARELIERVPVFIKRDVGEEQAETFFTALREIGAQVKLHKLATKHPSSMPPGRSEPSFIPAAPGLPFEAEGLPLPPMPEPETVAAGVHIPSSRPPPPAGSGSVMPPTGQPMGEARGSFASAVLGAYLYPVRKALPAVIGVAVVAQIASFVPLVGGFLSTGIWISYLFSTIKSASMGNEGMALGPDFTGWSDVIGPLVRCFLAVFVPLALLMVIYVLLVSGSMSVQAFVGASSAVGQEQMPVLFLVLLGLWGLFLPATLILAAHSSGCLGGLNFLSGARMIIREPIGYFGMVAALLPTVALMEGALMLGPLIAESVGVPFFLSGFITLALFMVPALAGARILGLFLWHYEDELGLV